jgi:hypothetical protein
MSVGWPEIACVRGQALAREVPVHLLKVAVHRELPAVYQPLAVVLTSFGARFTLRQESSSGPL